MILAIEAWLVAQTGRVLGFIILCSLMFGMLAAALIAIPFLSKRPVIILDPEV